MWKEKVLLARNFIVSKSKFVFPIILIVVVAITVTCALNASGERTKQPEESVVPEVSTEAIIESTDKEVPLVANEDSEIQTLIETFYNAQASGDAETLQNICDEISDKDMLRYLEIAKYTKEYSTLEIYTKPGIEAGTTIAYVYYKVVFENYEDEIPGYQAHYICTNEQGELYLKRSDNNEEINQYFKEVSVQADVVEFNNRINAEYNELMEQKPELLAYLGQLDSQVGVAVGEGLAKLASGGELEPPTEQGAIENGESTEEEPSATEEPSAIEEQQPVDTTENAVLYAKATTTVNVRSSDSQQADRLGKVIEGEKVQVLEQKVNGWTKIVFENKEGYIKSEYLEVIESVQSASSVESIGKVKALTNVNIRSSASESGEKIGTLAGGESAELIATENGWCKIKYQGQVAYVKAEYVE